MKTWQKPLWTLIRLLGLRRLFAGDAPEPTNDDWRNPFWRLSEKLAIHPEWHCSLLDIRLGFKQNGKWKCLFQMGKPVEQNFWNGIFTCQLYIVKTTIGKMPMILPRFGVVSRFARNWWFEAGAGWLFDKGQPAFKLTIMNWEAEEKFNPGVNAKGWDGGPV